MEKPFKKGVKKVEREILINQYKILAITLNLFLEMKIKDYKIRKFKLYH